MKKIGIITMHHVDNLGSILQSYALQHKIELMGYNAQIIDYRQHLQNRRKGNICIIHIKCSFGLSQTKISETAKAL